MQKKILSVSTVFILCIFFVQLANAQLINYDRRNKAPKANPSDTKVSTPAPAQKTSKYITKAAKKVEEQAPVTKSLSLPTEAKVTSRIERIYDVDRDGVLQTKEVQEFVRDVLSSIDRQGSFSASSEILKDFDANQDGQINAVEARELKKSLQVASYGW